VTDGRSPVYRLRPDSPDSLRPARPVTDHVVLVDPLDRSIGTLEKQRAHVEGRLHRALSVLVFNARGETLMQRRAAGKYHSGGRWTNACCSHPRPDEAVDAAARRRLREEMGIEAEVEPVFEFTYRADVGGGLVEHEYDHVFVARWEGEPTPDPDEADGWRWWPAAELADAAATEPERFTPWFLMIIARPEWPELVAGNSAIP
jgi:isopentenyl-diphosphate Delta-isomerase